MYLIDMQFMHFPLSSLLKYLYPLFNWMFIMYNWCLYNLLN